MDDIMPMEIGETVCHAGKLGRIDQAKMFKQSNRQTRTTRMRSAALRFSTYRRAVPFGIHGETRLASRLSGLNS